MSRKIQLTYEDVFGKKKHKYGNKFVVIDKHKFPSLNEANRYLELKLLLEANKIRNLKLQVPFILQPAFTNKETGKREPAIKYVADFTYEEIDSGKLIVEDAKSEATRRDKVYQLKRKMMAYNGYYIKEVFA